MPKKQPIEPPETYIFPPAIHIGAGSVDKIHSYISQWNSSNSCIITYNTFAPQVESIQKSTSVNHRLLLDSPSRESENNHIEEVLTYIKSIEADLIIAYGDHTLQWVVKLATLAWAEELHPPKSSRDTAYRPMTPVISLLRSTWNGLAGEALVQIEDEQIIEPTLYPKAVIMDPSCLDIEQNQISQEYYLSVAMAMMGALQTPPSPHSTARIKMILDYFSKTYVKPSAEDLFFIATQSTSILQMNYSFVLTLLKTLEESLGFEKNLIGTYLVWAICKRSPHMDSFLPPTITEENLTDLQKHLFGELKKAHITPDLREITTVLVPLGTSKGELTIIKDLLDGVDWYLRGRQCL